MGDIINEKGQRVGNQLGPFEDPLDCQSIDGPCPACNVPTRPEYDSCKFGLGSFDRCPKCGEVYNFEADEEE
jgi:hypothetical protein